MRYAGVIDLMRSPGLSLQNWPITRLLAALLILLVALSVVPIALWTAADTTALLTDRARGQVREMARATAERLDGRLAAIKSWGGDFSHRPAIRTWLETGHLTEPRKAAMWADEILAPFTKRHGLRGIFLALPEGRVLVRHGDVAWPGALEAWKPFRDAQAGAPVVAPVLAGGAGFEPYVAVLVAVRNPRSGRTVAVLVIEDSPQNLRAIIAPDSAQIAGSAGFLADCEGTVWLHGAAPDTRGNTLPKPDIGERIRQVCGDKTSDPFVRAFDSAINTRGSGILAPLQEVPGVYFLCYPDSFVTEPVAHQTRRYSLLLALLIGCALGLAVALAKWFARPIRLLQDAAEALRAGDLGVRAEVSGTNELGMLAETFNRMAAQLQAHAADLERQVAERTSQLTSANEELQVQAEELQAQAEELQAQAGELEVQRDELSAARDALVAAEQTKIRMFSGLSHDLRTPLQVIIGLAANLAEGDPADVTAEGAQQADRIMAAAQVLNGLVDDLLEIGKIQSGHRVDLDLSHVDYYGEVAGRALELLRPLAEEKGQTLAIRLPEDPLPDVAIDLERMARVLTNVLGNAIKFTPPGGRVDLSVAIEDGWVVTTVQDTGPGISPDSTDRLFEPYYRAEGGTEAGTGLGLAIARQIIEEHGGTIGVKSDEGCGTTVWFRLPVPATAPA
jgi:signal transduction histidine kinase